MVHFLFQFLRFHCQKQLFCSSHCSKW